MNTKLELRQYFLDQRKLQKDVALIDSLGVNFRKWLSKMQFRVVGSYKPMKKFNELDLSFIESIILELSPIARIAYPKIEGSKMNFYLPDELTSWDVNKWGINEIIDGKLILPSELDLLICPLLAIDTLGYRLGYGKGFYDHYIPYLSPKCIKLGIGMFEPIEKMPDIYQHDQKLDVYISPNGIYEFL